MVIETVALACRGEIAARICRTCGTLGVRTIALHTADDAAAIAARSADATAEVPSYLDAPGLAAAAKRAGATAVHPGYGFLSEAPAMAKACSEAGLVFIGPSAEVLALLGRKDAAREIAIAADVPVVPESGFPLLVKAAAGGGGRGMRIARSEAELDEAVAAAQREAEAAFGDGTVLFERYIEHARHVEVQFARDAHGTALTFGTRDCSLQRRHQKILEEAPALHAPPGIEQAALRLAARVGYVGIGTAEFLVAPDGTFSFLEINARIQVEHPVSEAIFGVDLVRIQLEIASGAELPASAPAQQGHAIEARICAEDGPQFLPTAGTVTELSWPAGVRVDAGIELGDEVGTRYDSLIAKLTVHAPDRASALTAMRTALAACTIEGLATNLPFLRWLVEQPEVHADHIDTGFVERVAGRVSRTTGRNPWTGHFRVGDPALPRRRVLAPVESFTLGAGAGSSRVEAPMPGSVARVEVQEGERVSAGQVLIVLEAMKLEHPLVAPFAGRIERVRCELGDIVVAGAVLIELGSATDEP